MEKFKALFSLFMLIGSFTVISFEQQYDTEGDASISLLIFFALASVFYWLYKGFCALLNLLDNNENGKKYYGKGKDRFHEYDYRVPPARHTSRRYPQVTQTDKSLVERFDSLMTPNTDIEILEVTDEVKEVEQVARQEIIGPPPLLDIPQEHQKYVPQPSDYNVSAITNGTATENIFSITVNKEKAP